jgi:hypothetical protein
MIKGGFGRKLDAAQVTLYKADWIQVVARDRADRRAKNAEETNASRAEIGSAIDELEELKQKNDLLGIVFLLDEFGNTKLRDEYIEELIAQESSDVGSQIYLRHMQGRLDLLDMQEVESYLTSARSSKAWTSLGRALVKLGRKSEATEFYLRYISEALKDGNTFSAAYYLKEAFENSLDTALFEKAYAESREKGDVWWELRSLQELELDDEVGALLRREGVDTPEGLLSKDEEPKEDD